MKVDSSIKLSDMISWAVMLLVAGTIYGTFKVDNFYLRRDVDLNRLDLDKLAQVVQGCSDGLLVLKTLSERDERERAEHLLVGPLARSPKVEAAETK